MDFGRLPVRVNPANVPLVAVERWRSEGDHPKALVKMFRFRRAHDRMTFVEAIMAYEEQAQHHAKMVLEEGTVEVSLVTKDLGQVTGVDREMALFCDAVFKDLVHAPDPQEPHF